MSGFTFFPMVMFYRSHLKFEWECLNLRSEGLPEKAPTTQPNRYSYWSQRWARIVTYIRLIYERYRLPSGFLTWLQSRSSKTFPQFDDVRFTLQNSSLGQIPTILNPRSTASLTWQDKRQGKCEMTTQDMQFLNMSLHKNASPLLSLYIQIYEQ